MSGNEYQELAFRTAKGLTADEQLVNGVMGLCGESGECIDIVKKWKFQGHELDADKLLDEVGDVLWYCALTLNGIGYSMNACMVHNIDKLMKRYPNGFEADKSIHRKEYENADRKEYENAES